MDKGLVRLISKLYWNLYSFGGSVGCVEIK